MRGLLLFVSITSILRTLAGAQAQETIKVGILTKLSGPLGTLGMA